MSRRIGVSLAALCTLLLAGASASAQAPPPYLYNRPNFGPGFRPQLSPYLNLSTSLNGTSNPAVNYFLRTIPELDRRATKQLYGAAIGGLEERALNPTPPAGQDVDLFTPLDTTGHATAFQYTGGYFPPMGGRSAGASTYQRPRAVK